MKRIIISNNPLVRERMAGSYEVMLYEVSFNELLRIARDMVHQGHALLSHPLSGSVKPNENPYKSVMISDKRGQMDLESLRIIEGAIATAEKFSTKFKNLTDSMRADFMAIDLSLISSCR